MSAVDWFRRMPTGGTVYARPSDSGNPYARIDEDPEAARPVVTVELPPFEEDIAGLPLRRLTRKGSNDRQD